MPPYTRLTFATPTLVHTPPTRSHTTRHRRSVPLCRASPPPNPPPRRRVRVHRKYTCHHPHWNWQGARRPPPTSPPSIHWLWPFSDQDPQSMLKALETLCTRSLTKGFARFTALGARVLRSMSDMLNRSLGLDRDIEGMGVEYGIAEPGESDKVYVDPLRDWDVGADPFYRDSFGRPVYLQLEGAWGGVMATDYREGGDDDEDAEPTGEGGDDDRPAEPMDSFWEGGDRRGGTA